MRSEEAAKVSVGSAGLTLPIVLDRNAPFWFILVI